MRTIRPRIVACGPPPWPRGSGPPPSRALRPPPLHGPPWHGPPRALAPPWPPPAAIGPPRPPPWPSGPDRGAAPWPPWPWPHAATHNRNESAGSAGRGAPPIVAPSMTAHINTCSDVEPCRFASTSEQVFRCYGRNDPIAESGGRAQEVTPPSPLPVKSPTPYRRSPRSKRHPHQGSFGVLRHPYRRSFRFERQTPTRGV